ncbi:MAG: phosphoribosylformylglycinamidine synthase subunit PurQ, partial [Oscillospiraceae bacterium]
MACVIEKENLEKFISLCNNENIEATLVAEVTDDNRLSMEWCGKEIVSLSRDFLNSNGATKFTDVEIKKAIVKPVNNMEVNAENIVKHLSDINNCSQKGLSERFDASIGAGSVFMPFGGENQLTPVQAMVAKIPVLKGETQTASVMSYGFNPFISEQSPYHGAMYAVVESVSKVVAAGGSAKECYLTFQEYFPRTNNDKTRWGLPMAALLGAYKAQIELGIAAIGGKDSMSGTFEKIDVPPTLCSFAVSVTQAKKAVSPEFKSQGNNVIMLLPKYDENQIPDFASLKEVYATVEKMISDGMVNACATLTAGGVTEVVAKMSLGNQIGVKFTKEISKELMFNPVYGGFILEIDNRYKVDEDLVIAKTTSKYVMVIPPSQIVDMHILQRYYEAKLEPCFPYKIEHSAKTPKIFTYKNDNKNRITSSIKIAKPRVLIPVFPGTNCEYDTARVFERAGAEASIFVVKNLNASFLQESIEAFAKEISKSQIVMLPGGFSGGDEPDGSAKFIVSFLKNPLIAQAVNELLTKQDGLMLGICNGFQALIKLGLLPYGTIKDQTENSPTLTFKTIGRHQSMVVNTRICSNKSPWLKNTNVSDVFSVPISHGEGRFVCDAKMLKSLEDNGQIATQYVDFQGQPTYDIKFNPNESYMAIEGITSQDG